MRKSSFIMLTFQRNIIMEWKCSEGRRRSVCFRAYRACARRRSSARLVRSPRPTFSHWRGGRSQPDESESAACAPRLPPSGVPAPPAQRRRRQRRRHRRRCNAHPTSSLTLTVTFTKYTAPTHNTMAILHLAKIKNHNIYALFFCISWILTLKYVY